MEPGSTGPEGMEGGAEGVHESSKQLPASVRQREPETTEQGSSTEWPSLRQHFQSNPASDERVGQGAQVSSSFQVENKALVCIWGRGICNTQAFIKKKKFIQTTVLEWNFSYSSLFLFSGKQYKAFCTVVAPPVVR